MKSRLCSACLTVILLILWTGRPAPTLAQGAVNWQVAVPAQQPTPRTDMGFVYDSDRGVVVAVGGASGNTLLDETWEYDGATWTQAFPANSPGARRRPAIAYDSARQVTVLFGGSTINDSAFFNDTWEYDGTNWVRRSTQTPPTPRNGAIMAYDVQRGRMLLFGGYFYGGATNFYDETWEYDGLQWTRLTPAQHPSTRETAAMVYDSSRARMVLFGGGRNIGSTMYNDTWEWDGVNWSQIQIQAAPPTRWAHAMTYDALRDRIVLFGGLSGSVTEYADTWEYSSATQTWTQVAPAASPPERWGHGMAYDPARAQVLLFGGSYYSAGYGQRNDTWGYGEPVTSAARPVVLLPGIAGSTLWDGVSVGCSGDAIEVWLAVQRLVNVFDLNDQHLQRLRLADDGYSPADSCAAIEATGVFGELTLLDLGVKDFYARLVARLTAAHYQVTPCAYDWRRSISGERYESSFAYDLPRRVDECVELARQHNPNVQVDIIGHSMGGLAARQYALSSPERAAKIHTIVTLGSPYWGSVKPFRMLQDGQTGIAELDLLINDDRIRELSRNAPSVYQLLPSRAYFDEIGPYLTLNAAAWSPVVRDYAATRNFLSTQYNGALVDQAERLHLNPALQQSTAMDDWRNVGLNVDYHVFVGTGINTLSGISENVAQEWGESARLRYTYIYGDGDKTTLTSSGTLEGLNGSYRGDATVCRFNGVDHGGLTSDGNVWVAIDRALRGQTPCGVGANSVTDGAAAALSTTYRVLTVEGPAVVHLWDEQGRHTGPTASGLIENGIPLVTYDWGPGQSTFALSPISVYTLLAEITGTGSISIRIAHVESTQGVEQTVLETVIFSEVAAGPGDRLLLSYHPLNPSADLRLDADLTGDGTIDSSTPPDLILDAEASSDREAPATSIMVQGLQNANGYYSGPVVVSLVAMDSGTGVDRIEYSLDGGLTGLIYSAPITVNAEDVLVLYVQAIDRAGNREYPWTQVALQAPFRIYIPLVRR